MRYQALQGPDGELSLAIFDGDSCVFYNTYSNIQFGGLRQMCEKLDKSWSIVKDLKGGYPDPQAAYDRHNETFTLIADSFGVYLGKMGPTARIEFGHKVDELETLYEEWVESNRAIYSEHFGDEIFNSELDELTDCGEDCNRTDFSEFSEFEQTISFYAMLNLECSYRRKREKT